MPLNLPEDAGFIRHGHCDVAMLDRAGLGARRLPVLQRDLQRIQAVAAVAGEVPARRGGGLVPGLDDRQGIGTLPDR